MILLKTDGRYLFWAEKSAYRMHDFLRISVHDDDDVHASLILIPN